MSDENTCSNVVSYLKLGSDYFSIFIEAVYGILILHLKNSKPCSKLMFHLKKTLNWDFVQKINFTGRKRNVIPCVIIPCYIHILYVKI